MSTNPSRRDVVSAAAAASLAGLLGLSRAAVAAPLKFGPARPFSFAWLADRARAAADAPYVPPRKPVPDIVEQIGYEQHGKMKFRADHALFADTSAPYPVTFFPVGKYFPKTVKMHAVEAGKASEVLYEPEYFDMPADSPAARLPEDTGFAGFQLREAKSRPDWRSKDWAAFLGASYFRAIGSLGEYGLSARGIAIDTATPRPEEFPDFTEFYIEPAVAEGRPVKVYALLDGPSIAGAYEFTLHRADGVVIDVEARLFARKDIAQLGVCPMTSMYWFSNYDKSYQLEWRNGAHDSDGLALWTGAGERIWRPLVNPPGPSTSAFVDENPRGFGLMQRDRDFNDYQDLEAHYERRPSVWIEPKGGWGEGYVELIEIPTDAEIHDNVVAYWKPAKPLEPGKTYTYGYRMHWGPGVPIAWAGVKVHKTRLGVGGNPEARLFVIDFKGPALSELGGLPRAEVATSAGSITNVVVQENTEIHGLRVSFELNTSGTDVVELRLGLKANDRQISESWLYRWTRS